MGRVLLCAVFLLGLAACDGGSDERPPGSSSGLVRAQARLAVLEDRLAEARDRADELELQAAVQPNRYVDLWRGGPTMRGPLLALPRLGLLRWTCDRDYGFRVVFEGYGASVYADYHVPGFNSARMIHPGQSLGATVAPGESVVWTITHRHKPGFIRARVEVTTARSKHGNCLLPTVRLRETGRLYD